MVSRKRLDFGHTRTREFGGGGAAGSPRDRKTAGGGAFWAACTSPRYAKFSLRFKVVIGAVWIGRIAPRTCAGRWRIECFLSNTRPKTAFRAVQNACSSLPGDLRRLMWACDGGGHPCVVPSGGSGALWEIGASRLRQREDRMTGEQGDLPGCRPDGDRTLPRNKWRLR